MSLGGMTSAQDKPELTIYAYDSFVSDWGPGPKIKVAFDAVCECSLKLVSAGDGASLLARLQLEGSNSKADVVLGLDTNLIAQAKATGLFSLHGQDTGGYDMPLAWEDDVFLPYDWGYFAFVYDQTKLARPPDSFEALINMPDDFKIIIQDPRSSSPGLGLLMWVKQQFGSRAPDIWAGLSPHILTVTKGWSEAYGMFLAGEADMVLSYSTSPAYHSIAEDNDTIKAAHFRDGHYMQVEVAAGLASSAHPELAQQFLQFMRTPAFQDVIPTTNWMFPVIQPAKGLPEAFKSLIAPQTSLIVPAADVEEIKSQALTEWHTALSQ